jgi:hypothetical protein
MGPAAIRSTTIIPANGISGAVSLFFSLIALSLSSRLGSFFESSLKLHGRCLFPIFLCPAEIVFVQDFLARAFIFQDSDTCFLTANVSQTSTNVTMTRFLPLLLAGATGVGGRTQVFNHATLVLENVRLCNRSCRIDRGVGRPGFPKLKELQHH